MRHKVFTGNSQVDDFSCKSQCSEVVQGNLDVLLVLVNLVTHWLLKLSAAKVQCVGGFAAEEVDPLQQRKVGSFFVFLFFFVARSLRHRCGRGVRCGRGEDRVYY